MLRVQVHMCEMKVELSAGLEIRISYFHCKGNDGKICP